jgi:hypothetical protein
MCSSATWALYGCDSTSWIIIGRCGASSCLILRGCVWELSSAERPELCYFIRLLQISDLARYELACRSRATPQNQVRHQRSPQSAPELSAKLLDSDDFCQHSGRGLSRKGHGGVHVEQWIDGHVESWSRCMQDAARFLFSLHSAADGATSEQLQHSRSHRPTVAGTPDPIRFVEIPALGHSRSIVASF